MKKSLAFLLVMLLLTSCADPALSSEPADVLIVPSQHQWIEQGKKVQFTAQWTSTFGIEKLEWLLDGVLVGEKALGGSTSGVSPFNFYAADYPVKTFSSGDVSSYEFGCQLYSMPVAAAGSVPVAWDEVVVYVCPPGSGIGWGEEPETPLDAPPEITSLSWHMVTDALGEEYLGIALAWTLVEDAIGYEIFARTGPSGTFAQKTECIETNVLAGFPMPDAQTNYFFRVRTASEVLVPETGDYDYLTGPFSAEASITVPAAVTEAWETAGPWLTLSPDLDHFPMRTPVLHLPALTVLSIRTPSPSPPPATRRPVLMTAAPLPVRTLLPIITPAPTLQIMPLPSVRIPLLPAITPAPVQPVAPILRIRP